MMSEVSNLLLKREFGLGRGSGEGDPLICLLPLRGHYNE